MMTGKLIGKYRITRFIGEGGMATVYEAVHETLNSKVAIKILRPEFTANLKVRERFKSEAVHTASLKHAGIIDVKDFEEHPDYLALVLEYLEGEDLGHRIKNKGPLPDSEVQSVFTQILDALLFAHERGIAHRDIKPSNIFILPDGRVKILDFGIAKIFGEGNEMTQTGTLMGTPIYMSPEQVKGEKSIDHRTDIYSLGVTLYYALTGKSPYDAESESWFLIPGKIVTEPLPEINSKYWPMICKACEKDRNKRYQECREWSGDFEKLKKENKKSELDSYVEKKCAQVEAEKHIPEWNLVAYLEDAKTLERLENLLDQLWNNRQYNVSAEYLTHAGFDYRLDREFEILCGKYRLKRLIRSDTFDLSINYKERIDKKGITTILFLVGLAVLVIAIASIVIGTCNKPNSAEAHAKYLLDSINLAEAQQRNIDSIVKIDSLSDSLMLVNVHAYADSVLQAISASTSQPENMENIVLLGSGEVRIGNQIWMTINLNVDRFRNGDPIPHARTAEEWKRAGERGQPAWCYYNNDPANGAKYGKLYNWYAVNDPRGLAPKGWQIPSDAEWQGLIDYLGGNQSAGVKLKSSSGWKENGGGTNASGFNGSPGGSRYSDGEFYNDGQYGNWWSSTVNSLYTAWARFLSYDDGNVEGYYYDKGYGLSVRCLRD